MATTGDVDDAYDTIMANILELCKNGSTKDKIIDQTNLSHEQLRRITAQMLDRELLHYIEARTVYITADKGYIFLDKRQQTNTILTNSKLSDRKNKTEQRLLNSITSEQNIIHSKLQLWTNKYQNEFAIRLTPNPNTITSENNNVLLAATNTKEDYITVVAETDYFEDLKHGWEYTLNHLVEQYKYDIHSKSSQDNISTENKSNYKNGNRNNGDNNTIPIRLIPYIKCQYCNLEFSSEREKKEHELEWHV